MLVDRTTRAQLAKSLSQVHLLSRSMARDFTFTKCVSAYNLDVWKSYDARNVGVSGTLSFTTETSYRKDILEFF